MRQVVRDDEVRWRRTRAATLAPTVERPPLTLTDDEINPRTTFDDVEATVDRLDALAREA